MREQWLARASAPLPMSWLIRLSGERLYRPMYHTVRGDEPLPHVEHLYPTLSRERFERDLDALLRQFDPVALDDLPDWLDDAEPDRQPGWKPGRKPGRQPGRRPGRRPGFFLTFDDGLREVLDVALPLLRAKGVPATVFVNSAFVDNRALFFRYLASALVDHAERHPPTQATAEAVTVALGEPADADLRRVLLGVPYARRASLDHAAELLGFDTGEFLSRQRPYLSVEQLMQMRSDGISIGAHSVDHPLYRDITLDEQLRQTRESCAFVSSTFGQAGCTFAFPFSDVGVSATFFERVREAQLADRLFGGQGFRSEASELMFQRHAIEGRGGEMDALIRADHVLALLRRGLGKYRVRRPDAVEALS